MPSCLYPKARQERPRLVPPVGAEYCPHFTGTSLHAGYQRSQPWSDQDDDDLLLAISGGGSLEQVAMFLCRSQSEVLKRAAELGLRWDATRH